MKNIWIVIPAREGSKGFPHKNRYLFEYTARQIPESLCHRTIVTTDDEQIIEQALKYNFKILKRDVSLCADNTSMKSVLKNVIEEFNIPSEHNVMALYLTYPQRTLSQIQEIYNFYLGEDATSLLCKKDIETHPYMCYYILDDFKGIKVVDHGLYRRQDYPKCFEACHYVVITRSGIIDKLDNNLHHKDTIFYTLQSETFDVDYLSDFDSFKKAAKK